MVVPHLAPGEGKGALFCYEKQIYFTLKSENSALSQVLSLVQLKENNFNLSRKRQVEDCEQSASRAWRPWLLSPMPVS